MNHSIALILPNHPTYHTVKEVLAENGWEYPVFNLSGKKALTAARDLAGKDTHIIISTGVTYEYLRDNLDISVFELPFSSLLVTRTIRELLNLSGKIAHIGSHSYWTLIQQSLDFLGESHDRISHFPLDFSSDVEAQVSAVIDQGFDIIIGNHDISDFVRKRDKVAAEIDVDRNIVEKMLLTVRTLEDKIIAELRGHEFENALFETVSEAILITYRDRTVYSHNSAASVLFGNDIAGRQIEDILASESIVDIASTDVHTLDPDRSYTPAIISIRNAHLDNGDPIYIYSVNIVSDKRKISYKTRRELMAAGLYANNTFESIHGTSAEIAAAKAKALTYAQYDSPILITGETGTGKELFAQSIHNASVRRFEPFVPVNCAALPEHLIESELFGYVKGAFTGASSEGRVGYFELANGGTIFLDEVSELPLSIQGKLLRTIQEGEIIRVGDHVIRPVNVRIICSSNKDLKEMVRTHSFKDDLYYRINVLELVIPPLRCRREDIGLLAEVFLREFRIRHNKDVTAIDPDVIDRLQTLPFNGNVRELSNLIERLVILSQDNVIHIDLLMDVLDDDIPVDSPRAASAPAADFEHSMLYGDGSIDDMQKRLLHAALIRNGGRRNETAKELGISPATLWRRLKRYDLI